MARRESPVEFEFSDSRLPAWFWKDCERGAGGCWLWTGRTNGAGYGLYFHGPKGHLVLAHRRAFEALHGPIQDELDHLCKMRNCCNPAHLEDVTRRENVLRSNNMGARNARKTHCDRGHPFDEANTFRLGNGGRGCRTCRREYQRDSYRRRKSGRISNSLALEALRTS